MPMQWIDPEKFVTAQGPDGPVTVYHAYKDNKANIRLVFHYTIHVEGEPTFDVRDVLNRMRNEKHIAVQDPSLDGVHDGRIPTIKKFIKLAITTGAIRSEE